MRNQLVLKIEQIVHGQRFFNNLVFANELFDVMDIKILYDVLVRWVCEHQIKMVNKSRIKRGKT
jgi:SAM-dependent MidA family methyltransferase